MLLDTTIGKTKATHDEFKKGGGTKLENPNNQVEAFQAL